MEPTRPQAQPIPKRIILDVRKELSEIRNMYDASTEDSGTNFLVYGGFGTGKTTLITTCREPILIHSFDPGGTESITDALKTKEIYVDTRYEGEDPLKPTVWEKWDKEFNRLYNGDVLNTIGTFVIDSGTTWAQAALNLIIKKAGRAGGAPFQQDYLPAMTLMENAIRKIMSAKCDFLFICHEDVTEDKTLGKMFIGPQLTGKLRQRIPLLFSELYVATASVSSSGVEYRLLTQATGLYRARTRMGNNGKFETYEKPDITYLLKKANKYKRKEVPASVE